VIEVHQRKTKRDLVLHRFIMPDELQTGRDSGMSGPAVRLCQGMAHAICAWTLLPAGTLIRLGAPQKLDDTVYRPAGTENRANPSGPVRAFHLRPLLFVTLTGAFDCGAFESAMPPPGSGGPPNRPTCTAN
jgi:hypothetical protein